MAVDSLQITAKTAAPDAIRERGRPFRKGQSGNPAGRPRGSKNHETIAAEIFLEGEAAALTRKAVEMALGGDGLAMRLCLDRVMAPRRNRAVRLALPPIRTAADLAAAMTAVAAAEGLIVPAEAFELAQALEVFSRTIAASDLARRVRELEEAYAARS